VDNQVIKVAATVSFPSMTRPNQMSGKYSIQLSNLSDAAVEKLEELGISVKFKDDAYNRGRFIECKSSFPIDNSKFETVVDDAGLPLDSNKVGPGSKVEALLKPFDWTMGNRSGTSPRLMKLVVREIAKAESLEDSFEDIEAL